jgi:hypothetical protein
LAIQVFRDDSSEKTRRKQTIDVLAVAIVLTISSFLRAARSVEYAVRTILAILSYAAGE